MAQMMLAVGIDNFCPSRAHCRQGSTEAYGGYDELRWQQLALTSSERQKEVRANSRRRSDASSKRSPPSARSPSTCSLVWAAKARLRVGPSTISKVSLLRVNSNQLDVSTAEDIRARIAPVDPLCRCCYRTDTTAVIDAKPRSFVTESLLEPFSGCLRLADGTQEAKDASSSNHQGTSSA